VLTDTIWLIKYININTQRDDFIQIQRLGNVKFIQLFLSLYYTLEMLLIAHASNYVKS